MFHSGQKQKMALMEALQEQSARKKKDGTTIYSLLEQTNKHLAKKKTTGKSNNFFNVTTSEYISVKIVRRSQQRGFRETEQT